MDSFRESQIWHEATSGPWIRLSAESRIQPSKAFVIFIVILLTQFPTQHRYTDTASDLQIKIPYKAEPAPGVQRGGRLSDDLVEETFSKPIFGGNSIKFSVQANKLNVSLQGPIFMSDKT